MERLTAEDQLMLWPDQLWPQEIGCIGVLEGENLFDSTGSLKIDEVAEVIAARVHLAPGFASSCTNRAPCSARRCGWIPPSSTFATTCIFFRYGHPLMRPSCCSRLSNCGRAAWIGRGHCGRCGSSPGSPEIGSACS
jgi:hypothetical protein